MLRLVVALFGLLASAAMADSGPPLANTVSLEGLSLPAPLLGMFDEADLAVMAAIGTLTFFLDRAEMITDRVTMILPLILGGIWGCVEALAASATGEPLATIEIVAQTMRGLVLNGATAGVVGILTQRALSAAMRPPAS